MNKLFTKLQLALRDRKGVTALEYGVIAAGIVVAVAAAAVTLGGSLTTLFGSFFPAA